MPPREDHFPRLKAAAVQAASVALDRDATIDKLEALTAEAAGQGADLVVFSESFVPGFPVWNAVLAPIDQHDLFTALARNSVTVPGPHSQRLAAIARRHAVMLSVGVTERSEISVGCLWNSNLVYDRTGRLVNHRRKLVPTWTEKLTWASGDARGLESTETDCGRIGALICGENTNTLARYALLATGEQVHIATYPPVWPTQRPERGAGYDLPRAVEIRSAAHAFEGKVFSVVSSGVLDDRTVELIEQVDPKAAEVVRQAPRPVSMILGPTGARISDLLEEPEGIVYADIDVADSIEQKQFHDIVGYYQRFDLFRFSVDTRAQGPISAPNAEVEDGMTDDLPSDVEPRAVARPNDVGSAAIGDRGSVLERGPFEGRASG